MISAYQEKTKCKRNLNFGYINYRENVIHQNKNELIFNIILDGSTKLHTTPKSLLKCTKKTNNLLTGILQPMHVTFNLVADDGLIQLII